MVNEGKENLTHCDSRALNEVIPVFSFFSGSEFYMPSVRESSPSALALVSTFGIMACQRIGREEVNSWRIAGSMHWVVSSVDTIILVVHDHQSIHQSIDSIPIKAIIRRYVSALSGLLLFLGGFFSVLRLADC